MGDSPGLTQARARPRVIVLPAELNIANAGLCGEQLDSALVPGVTVVIADMTDTTQCDTWGIRTLAVAHRRATAHHAELRLVVPSAALRHTFALMGLLLPLYASMSSALSLA
jgi:anti-anti-sigma regulatory factor